MFRDSRGVVHTVCSPDPLTDLPAAAADVLREALLAPVADADAVDELLERGEAVEELLERWQDAFFAALPDEVDLAEESVWAARAGVSLDDVEQDGSTDEDDDDDEPFAGQGHLELDLELVAADPDDPEDPRSRLGEELVSRLERELLLLPMRERLEALVAAGSLVAGWQELLMDDEKLLGHLVLAHGEEQARRQHAELADRHAALHAATGPGHAASPEGG